MAPQVGAYALAQITLAIDLYTFFKLGTVSAL
jgi:hypothetical protein